MIQDIFVLNCEKIILLWKIWNFVFTPRHLWYKLVPFGTIGYCW